MSKKPMSTARATVISLIGCALVFALFHRWGGWPLNVLGTAVFGGGWAIMVFAAKSVGEDNAKTYTQIRAEVEQQPPVLRLAVAMAQPLRSYQLNMPIVLLTDSFNDYGLYMVHRLHAEQYQHAQDVFEDWLEHVRRALNLAPDAPLDFAQSLPILLSGRVESDSQVETEEQATSIVRLCHRIHTLLCAIEVDAISVESGQSLLQPLVEQVQQRYASWEDYARELKLGKWTYMRKDLFGITAQTVHFKDLLGSRMSPWQLTDIQLKLPS